MQLIRAKGDWESWLKFYLTGIRDVSQQAGETAKKLLIMSEEHRQKIQQQLGRATGSALRVHDLFKKRVILSLPVAQDKLNLSFPAVNKAIKNMEKLGLVRELTGRQRDRLFCYEPYLRILTEATETIEKRFPF